MLVAALLLSACFSARIDLVVADDGAADLVVAVDTPAALDGVVQSALDDAPTDAGVDVEEYNEGQFRGLRIMADAADLPDVSDVVVAPRPDGGWEFRLEVPEAPPIGGDPTLEVTVLLPGRQAENNADRLGPDGAFVWEVALDEPGQVLVATTVPGARIIGEPEGDDDVNWLWVAVPIVVVLGLAGAGAALARRAGPY